MVDEDVVSIDRDLIKVLAADSRRDILRLLNERQMTLTEMADRLSLKKATVSEHLKRLVEVGLIERREDERLWVYYHLSRSGKRVVNPGRTRFYLVMGASVASAIAGIFLAYLFLSSPASDPIVGDDGLALRLADERASAGGPLELRAFLEGAEPGAVDAYLLTADQAAALRADEGPVEGTPLVVQEAAEAKAFSASSSALDETEGAGSEAAREASADDLEHRTDQDAVSDAGPGFVQLSLPAALPPGTYFVYVRDAAGNDNRAELATVVVDPVEVSLQPDVWYRGLDPAVSVRLAQSGVPLDGTLVLSPLDGERADVTVPVVGGHASLAPDLLDAAAPGLHQLKLLREGSAVWVDLQRTLDVRDPQIAVVPRAVAAGAPQDVQVLVRADTDAPVPVRVNGTDVPVTRDPDGTLHVTLAAPRAGPVAMVVGRLANEQLIAVPDLAPSFTVDEGGRLLLRVADASGPAADVTVALDDRVVGLTDADGTLDLERPTDGLHRLTLAEGGDEVERAIDVEGWNVTEPTHLVGIDATAAPAAAREIRLRVRLTNDAPASTVGTLIVEVNGALVATRAESLGAGESVSRDLLVHWPDPGTVGVSLRWTSAWAPAAFANTTQTAPAGGPAASPSPAMDSASALAYAAEGPGALLDVEVKAPPVPPSVSGTGLPLETLVPAGEAPDAETPGLEIVPVVFALASVAYLARRRRR